MTKVDPGKNDERAQQKNGDDDGPVDGELSGEEGERGDCDDGQISEHLKGGHGDA